MKHRVRCAPGALLAAGFLALLLPTTALAAPAIVSLRLEGATSTIYEGPVTTDSKTLSKDSTGLHPCDGTNAGANPAPGPTMTSALDDGTAAGAYTWAGTWFSFGDFGIDRIGPDAGNTTQFWGYALNFTATSVGGCQQQVRTGDDVLYAYDFFSKTALLKLTGPTSASVGEPVTVTVTDGQTGAPAAGASVAGRLTGSDGRATLSFPAAGLQRVKAERSDAVRSNRLDVCVHAGADGTCGTARPGGGGATGKPAARLVYRAPDPEILGLTRRVRLAADKGPRELRGRINLGSSRLLSVRLRLTRKSGGRCAYFSGSTESFRRTRCGTGWSFAIGDRARWSYLLPERLGPGRYVLQVIAKDATGAARAEDLVFFVKAKAGRR